jgi:hypothetical protein
MRNERALLLSVYKLLIMIDYVNKTLDPLPIHAFGIEIENWISSVILKYLNIYLLLYLRTLNCLI